MNIRPHKIFRGLAPVPMHFIGTGLALLVALTCSAPALYRAVQGTAPIKLYLKDGSYQLVKSYEVKGNRVRYYSLERSEWEEIPAGLVDFDATKRTEEEERRQQQKQLQEVQELEKQRFDPRVVSGFEVAPGIHLPQEPGVYAFDGVRVIPMVQSSAEVVKDKKRLALILALPAPVMKNRSLVVLPGAKAAVRLRGTALTFFVQMAESAGSNFDLLAVKSGKENRVVEKFQSGIGVGKSGELRSGLPLERTQIAPGLLRLRPAQPLAPGEYVLGELLRDPHDPRAEQEKLNLELWDFGVEK